MVNLLIIVIPFVVLLVATITLLKKFILHKFKLESNFYIRILIDYIILILYILFIIFLTMPLSDFLMKIFVSNSSDLGGAILSAIVLILIDAILYIAFFIVEPISLFIKFKNEIGQMVPAIKRVICYTLITILLIWGFWFFIVFY